jgi:hypothetical protein
MTVTRVEYPTTGLRGAYRDVLRDPAGRVAWDRGWQHNAIVADCRRLLATFMRGVPASAGVFGLAVGAGQSQWDDTGPPPPTTGQSALVDPSPFTVGAANLQVDFLDGGTVSGTPTNRIQIQATLGPNVPPWPGGNHPTGNLREFGLVGKLAGTNVLINYVTHLVIAKDPASTLERTIWLTF